MKSFTAVVITCYSQPSPFPQDKFSFLSSASIMLLFRLHQRASAPWVSTPSLTCTVTHGPVFRVRSHSVLHNSCLLKCNSVCVWICNLWEAIVNFAMKNCTEILDCVAAWCTVLVSNCDYKNNTNDCIDWSVLGLCYLEPKLWYTFPRI